MAQKRILIVEDDITMRRAGAEGPGIDTMIASGANRSLILARSTNKRIEKNDIVRVAVPDITSAESIKQIKQQISIPLIADIHFDYKLAIASIKAGVDGLRLNPGNIGSEQNVLKVVDAAREKKIPIRIGVNAGSLEKDLKKKFLRSLLVLWKKTWKK